MDATIGPLKRLEALACDSRSEPILGLLRSASLAPNDIEVVGKLVSFLATPERIRTFEQWSAESTLAQQLARLGEAAWGDAKLLTAIRPVGEAHLAKRQLHGRVRSHYLATMAAARRANHLSHPKYAPFLERLRLLLMVRALEATAAGVPDEVHLAATCASVRQFVDRDLHGGWQWISRISHNESASIDDFVLATQVAGDEALAQAASKDERDFLRSLDAVLRRERTARGKGLTILAGLSPPTPPPVAIPWIATDLTSAVSGDIVALSDEAEEAVRILVIDVDPGRPPTAQRAAGRGLVLQTIEHAQFLRHSWHRLGLQEEPAFVERLNELRSSAILRERLGSALVGIAALASMPLSRLSEIQIRSGLKNDWSIDLAAGCLRRLPPRPTRRWRAGLESVDWISPLANEWRIGVSQPTLSILREVRVRGGISAVELWSKVSPDCSIESWFAEQLASVDGLARLTSPVVGNILSQQIFERHQDHAEARLLTSSTRTALPSACTYGSFTSSEVGSISGTALHHALGLVRTLGAPEGNAGGSELDVDVRRLRSAIARLTDRVAGVAIDPSRWVEHHNLLTALTIVALLASTGARPVTSGFEALSWFDFERRLVYVEDKRSGPTQGSRLCVLSERARQFLVERYLPHLKRLEEAVCKRMPRFSEQLRKLLQGEPGCKIPLFFFLRASPEVDWIEVSETQLGIVCDHPWPLPWNLFRHLHSTSLRRLGLHPDVRDALMSHGERGAESHGDFSWRTPVDDLKLATPMVDELAERFGLVLPPPGVTPQVDPGPWNDLGFSQAPSFGRQARHERREKVQAAARWSARVEIERRLGKRPPSSLSSVEWDDVARRMVLRDDGIPHAQASLRYEVLEEFLTEIWRRDRVRVPMRRRYIPLGEGRAWFSEDAVIAPRRLDDLRRALDDLDPKRDPGPDVAGCFAALELALHCRVSNFMVLSAVARNLESVELIRFQGRYWLECAYAKEWRDGRPVYRVAITERAAGWIGLRRDGSQRLKTLPRTPTALVGIGGLGSTSLEGLLRSICALVFQVNGFELPCAMAAMLHGRREAAALPHSDWIRTTCMQAPVQRDLGPGEHADADEPAAAPTAFFKHHGKMAAAGKADALKRCVALFDGIEDVFARPTRSAAKHMAAEVQRLVKQSGFGAGEAPYVLGHYVHHLLTRPKKNKASEGLRPDTARRYWHALKAGVLDFAFDCYLPSLDDEELTALYQQIVDAAEMAALFPGSRPEGTAKRRSKLKPDSDAGRRTVIELQSFHEFARGVYGMDDPDWNEISPGIDAGSGRPGIVLMAEYEAILSTLVSIHGCSTADDHSLASAFVLFACARFGLRVGEAVGMHRSDWVELAGSIVVLVRSNATRPLKTETSSKRQVPLVGQLEPVERALVDEVCRRWLHRHPPYANAALLPDVDSEMFVSIKGRISTQLLHLIKQVTGNPACVIHHLRHGYACRLLVLLHGRPYGLGLPCNEDDMRATRRLLLQGVEPDRRALWALGRMLGHSSPATSIKSYLHLLDQWVPEPPHRPALHDLHVAARCIELDQVPTLDLIAAIEPLPSGEPAAALPLFGRYVQYLRLKAVGHRQAAELAHISPSEQRRIDEALSAVATKIRQEGPDPALRLISKVPEKRWRALITMTEASPPISGCIEPGVWFPTVGASGQVVLFLPRHFDWIAAFTQALGLSQADCWAMHNNNAEAALLQQASDAGLKPLLLSSDKYGKWFQLDKAEQQSPRRTYTDRVAMLPRQGGKFANSRELLLLWAAWLTAGGHDPMPF